MKKFKKKAENKIKKRVRKTCCRAVKKALLAMSKLLWIGKQGDSDYSDCSLIPFSRSWYLDQNVSSILNETDFNFFMI